MVVQDVIEEAEQYISAGHRIQPGYDTATGFMPFMPDGVHPFAPMVSLDEIRACWTKFPWLDMGLVLDRLAVAIINGRQSTHDHAREVWPMLNDAPCAWFPLSRNQWTAKYFFDYRPAEPRNAVMKLGVGSFRTGYATVVPPSSEGKWVLPLDGPPPLESDPFLVKQLHDDREAYLETKPVTDRCILRMSGMHTTIEIRDRCWESVGKAPATVYDALARLKRQEEISVVVKGRAHTPTLWLIP